MFNKMSDKPTIESEPDEANLGIAFDLLLRAIQNGLIYGYRVRFLHSIAFQLVTIKKSTSGINLLEKLWKSIHMGLDHGKILATFAVCYRFVLSWKSFLKSISKNKNPTNGLFINFIAGFIGGIFVYGGILNKILNYKKSGDRKKWISIILSLNDAILTQITMFTLSRLLVAVGRDIARTIVLGRNKNKNSNDNKNINNSKIIAKEMEKLTATSWTIACGLIWGGIMVYYQRDRNNTTSDDKSTLYLPRALRISLEFIYGGAKHAWQEAFDYSGR